MHVEFRRPAFDLAKALVRLVTLFWQFQAFGCTVKAWVYDISYLLAIQAYFSYYFQLFHVLQFTTKSMVLHIKSNCGEGIIKRFSFYKKPNDFHILTKRDNSGWRFAIYLKS